MTGPAPGPRPGEAAVVAGLRAALAAENAAVFGYGVAGAHLAGPRRAAATAYWDDHREARDALAALLRARGQQQAAADAYRLPSGVHDAAEAVSLAVVLEDGVTAGYLGLVAAGDTRLRAFAARAMQDSAVRAAFWRGSAVAFPGITAAGLNPPRHRRAGR